MGENNIFDDFTSIFRIIELQNKYIGEIRDRVLKLEGALEFHVGATVPSRQPRPGEIDVAMKEMHEESLKSGTVNNLDSNGAAKAAEEDGDGQKD